MLELPPDSELFAMIDSFQSQEECLQSEANIQLFVLI